MHIPRLLPRLNRECPVGSSWYTCQSNAFKGCCEVDPCDLATCPSSPGAPTEDAATTPSAHATTTAITTTVSTRATMTVSSSPSEAVGSSSSSITLIRDTTLLTAAPAQPTAHRPPGAGTGAVETPVGIAGGSGEDAGEIRGGTDMPAGGLPVGAIAGIVLAAALVVLGVCAVLWWRLRWRRRRPRAGQDEQCHHHDETHARGLAWTSESGYFGPGDDSATTTAAGTTPRMGYSAVIKADRGVTAAAAAVAAPVREGSRHHHHRQPSPPQHFSDGKDSMMVPIGMAHPCQAASPGGHSRWESPDDIRWCTAVPSAAADRHSGDANSDLVSPVSPESSSCGPSRQGSCRYTGEVPPASAVAAAAAAHSQLLPPGYQQHQPQQQQQQHPQQPAPAPYFELDGREICPPLRPSLPPQPQRHGDGATGYHPAPLRLGSRAPLRRPPRLVRRASDAGHYPPAGPRQPPAVAAVPPLRPHSRSLSGGGGDGGGRYHTVAGQHQEQQPPPPVYRQQSQDHYEDRRGHGGDARPRATLRATRHEVEAGVHAGSWSVLSPA
ncbi:hypothetical protein RB598_005256 [Gaeumannomyces tritici]